MAIPDGWSIHAAGEPRASYQHVGYAVFQASIEATYWRPAWPGVTWLFVALAALLLAKRPGQRWPSGLHLANAASGLVLIVLALLLLPAGIVGDTGPIGLLVGWPVLLGLLLRACMALAAQTRADTPNAKGVGCLAALLVVVGLGMRGAGERALRPEVPRRMADIERVAALTEADALRLGRWPTADEWQARYGSLRTRFGEPFEYTLYKHAEHPWEAYTVSCSPGGHVYLDEVAFNSREFGEDGLFGTSDDRTKLATNQFAREQWPHGRAPRACSTKLPPAPATTRR